MSDLHTAPYHVCPHCPRELEMCVENKIGGCTAVVFRCKKHGSIDWDKVRKLLRSGNTILDPRGIR